MTQTGNERNGYSMPASYSNLDDRATAEEAEPPISGPRNSSSATYNVPDSYASLDEAAAPSPVQHPDQESINHDTLERIRTREQESQTQPAPPTPQEKPPVSRLLTQTYTISYLILFSILGTLSRLALQSLTTYPSTPILFPSLWPNFTGCLLMGFLSQHRKTATTAPHPSPSPLYLGLTTGLCGSLTSFSSFARDLFLALSNDLPPSTPRNGGYSLAAVLAVLITTLSVSLSALFLGAHLSLVAACFIPPSLPKTTKWLDRLAPLLALVAWLAALLLCILPPAPSWRGAVAFALLFAPLGCLARFWISLYLNGRMRFPLGTFTVNVVGTAVLGIAWDLAHVPLGGTVGCAVLQGVEDGFCGSLTTVSKWVVELVGLRRGHAYVYGGMSVGVGLGVLVAVMGGLRWSEGWRGLECVDSF
ncbi:CrcB-like protein-domain-containing protein [Podospora conica]|nr:CrcB-like protein-domain-containing protein [Schizothecium conicum]